MIGSLCIKRLGMELLIMGSAFLAPMGLPEAPIVARPLSVPDQICIDNTLMGAIGGEYISSK